VSGGGIVVQGIGQTSNAPSDNLDTAKEDAKNRVKESPDPRIEQSLDITDKNVDHEET
jgi:hypothetical protein